MEQSFQKGVVLHLASLIEYTEGGVISKQLIKSPAGNITLFSFDKGEGLSEHRAPFDALVQVLEGVVNITVNIKTKNGYSSRATNLLLTLNLILMKKTLYKGTIFQVNSKF